LRLLLLKGTISGPKTAKISSWPGSAVYSPIENAKDILVRDEFDNPGVYILKSAPQKNIFSERVYIGEAEELRARLKNHISKLKKKPFDSFVAFTDTNHLLNKATVKYLEHKLLICAKENKTSEIANEVSPKMPRISEADRYNMDGFLSEMKVILPLLGFEFVTPMVTPTFVEKPKDLFRLKSKQLNTFMFVSEGAFIVTKGSQASKTSSASIGKSWLRIRSRLIEQGVFVDQSTHYEITQDTIFSSVSAASSVTLGRQSPGPISWIHLTENITYSEFIQIQNID
ncbi:MAG TPA: GIY-YIG nuclease family protein, partial [Bacteroidetes bacterium]|nr:GIY-YIG nuclease family protein [Bacteroidota bacterium]